MENLFESHKMYTYVKGFAAGANMQETLKALYFAREKHSLQLRKNGEPYIIHPLTMACNAIAIGIRDDEIVATILLHDIVEDCSISIDDLPVNDNIKRSVGYMTFNVREGRDKKN